MTNKSIGFFMLAGGTVVAVIGGILYWRSKNDRTLSGVTKTRKGGMTLSHHRDGKMGIRKRLGILQDLTYDSIRDPRMRKIALDVTKNCEARDAQCETKAVYDTIRNRIRYTGDIAAVKMGKNGPKEAIDLFQSAYRTWEFGGGDCLPLDTKVLKEDGNFVVLAELNPGDRIMGHEGWTTVTERWLTGMKQILAFELNNGLFLRCSPEHKLFLKTGKEIRAGEVKPGDHLLSKVRSATQVVGIRLAGEEMCADITTDSGKFWLPESDVLVHNCDDHSVLAATLLSLNGIEAKFRVTAKNPHNGVEDWSHIYTMAGFPKNDPRKWVAIDTTLPGNYYGVEAPYGKKADFDA